MNDKREVMNLDAAELETRGNGGRFECQQRRIGPDIGLKKLGCSLYIVPPGKSAFPYHAHSLIEEMCIVLDGEGTLRQNDREQPIQAGDVIASNVGMAHQIINTSEQDLRYLVVSNNETVDVMFYPDSDKIGAYSEAFGETLMHFTHRSKATGYYDGEA